MRSEFPGLLYCAGALIAVTSWALFMFSKEVHRKGRTVSILRLPVIWILFLVSSAPALASYPVFGNILRIHGSRCPRFLQSAIHTATASSDLHSESVRIDMLLHGSCQQAQKNRTSKNLNHSVRDEMPWKKPLFPLALVPLAVGLVLISVVIGSKNREENAKGLFCVSSRRSWSLPAR